MTPAHQIDDDVASKPTTVSSDALTLLVITHPRPIHVCRTREMCYSHAPSVTVTMVVRNTRPSAYSSAWLAFFLLTFHFPPLPTPVLLVQHWCLGLDSTFLSPLPLPTTSLVWYSKWCNESPFWNHPKLFYYHHSSLTALLLQYWTSGHCSNRGKCKRWIMGIRVYRYIHVHVSCTLCVLHVFILSRVWLGVFSFFSSSYSACTPLL